MDTEKTNKKKKDAFKKNKQCYFLVGSFKTFSFYQLLKIKIKKDHFPKKLIRNGDQNWPKLLSKRKS